MPHQADVFRPQSPSLNDLFRLHEEGLYRKRQVESGTKTRFFHLFFSPVTVQSLSALSPPSPAAIITIADTSDATIDTPRPFRLPCLSLSAA